MTKKEATAPGLIVYSSKTGNTRSIAMGVFSAFGNRASISSVGSVSSVEPYSWLILGFWVDRGTMDPKAKDFLQSVRGHRIALIGTLGAYPDSAHATRVKEETQSLVSLENECLGCFLCQGRIDPALTKQFETYPPDHPHYMSEERKKRHLEAANHPNDEDIRAAVKACEKMLQFTDAA